MNAKKTEHPTTERSKGKWLALGAILVGLLYVGGGLWLLSRSSRAASAAAPTATPGPTATWPVVNPTSQLPTPTAQAKATPTDEPTAVPLSGDLFQLAIIHSNDTWGYTTPCG